jgi:3-oxoacyl-[acyl-carrier-protein] synthase II
MDVREVVITGVGLVTALGATAAENGERLLAGETGLARMAGEGLPDFLRVRGRVGRVELPTAVPQKLMSQQRFLNRSSLLGLMAAHEAAFQAGPGVSLVPPERRALAVAAGDLTKVGYDFLYPATREAAGSDWQTVDCEGLNVAALDKVNPFFLLESIANNLFSFLSAFLNFMGENSALGIHSPCGLQGLEVAWRQVALGKADVAMAVACSSWVDEVPLYELHRLGFLSRCAEGVASYKPLDARRDGLIPGEGGAALVLEAAAVAEARGARVLGRIRGFGNCLDGAGALAAGTTLPSRGCGLRAALAAAGCEARDLAFINLFGEGTRAGDDAELRAALDVLGPDHDHTAVTALKASTGHLGVASDVAEVVLGLHAAQAGVAPPTLHFEAADAEFAKLRIAAERQPLAGKSLFLSQACGVLGQSATVIIEAL